MSNFNNNGLGDGGLSRSRDKQLGKAVVNVDGSVTGLFKNDEHPQATTDSFQFNDKETEAEARKQILKILADITEREENSLKTVHTRYCIIKGIPINISDVSRYTPSQKQRPNYWEYWLFYGTKHETFLMSREVFIEHGEVKMNCLFNKEIARGDEND